MTEKVTKPRQRKKKETVKNQEGAGAVANVPKPKPARPRIQIVKQEPTDAPTPLPLAVVRQPLASTPNNPQLEGEDAIRSIRFHYKLPMLYQPSQAEAYESAFISHFVELNRTVRSASQETPWVSQIPGLHRRATKPALKLSIRAASMAFYAQVHQEPSILTDSYRWYTMSLNTQRAALSKLDRDAIPDEEELLVPIILGLYEVYAGTTPTSVFQHLTAATRIFALRGPRNMASGVANTLLKAIRISDAHKAVMFNQPSVLSTPEWMTLPFVLSPKNAHQLLNDVVLQIPACIALSGLKGSLGDVFTRDIAPGTDLGPVRERTAQLIQNLDDWADKYPHLCEAKPGTQVVALDMGIYKSPTSPQTPASPSLMLPGTFIALIAASYNATRLILTLLQQKISSFDLDPTPTTAVPHPMTPIQSPNLGATLKAVKFSQTILAIASYLESTHPVGFDFMRSVFPLVCVAALGPRPEDQNVAKEMLVRWGTSRGVGGLCGAWRQN
ncbi:hypothetical protein BDV96DRAFT_644466 [Lophiotrema nucula]|uniref:Fungal-specific transcription factor domain-containing protein n=1 Tax=Lophiotrema nucula TaxID=690887 RepID=A0A6A5ZF28_9PLEO|nr:hypothetical protein BDV96DRAFT_644466 [Lophiotrema nucula]